MLLRALPRERSMIPALQARRAEIAEICRRYHVKRLDVFGSAARESDFSDASDIDLLVEYGRDQGAPTLEDFFSLRDALTDVLGRRVDLVDAGAVRNPYIRESIERSRQPLHGA